MDNVFVIDASVHVNNGGFNPALTIMAIAYYASDALVRDGKAGDSGHDAPDLVGMLAACFLIAVFVVAGVFGASAYYISEAWTGMRRLP